MAKKLTTEEFISRAKKVHGDKYEYSKVEYFDSRTKVCIICPEHGDFWQSANIHLRGHGCPICKSVSFSSKTRGVPKLYARRIIYGVGINDLKCMGKAEKSYHIWRQILFRCYSKYTWKRKTYIGCTVCDEWKYYSNFKRWFDKNYVEGWCLDKDILVNGNKEYAPDKCCFVPNEINVIFNRHQGQRSKTGIMGVQLFKGKYVVFLSKYGVNRQRGSFDNIIDAMNFYKLEREKYIREVADKWKDKISPNVYNAIMRYEVNLKD